MRPAFPVFIPTALALLAPCAGPALDLEAGCVLFHGGDSRFCETIKHNDTLFFKLVFDINGL